MEIVPGKMNPESLTQLAVHPHDVSTGNKDTPGRLRIRDVLDHEFAQFKHILLTPENRSYPGAEFGLTDSTLRKSISMKQRKKERAADLFIILKPGLEALTNMQFEREAHIVDDGHVIGLITLTLAHHPKDPSDCGAFIGIIIHHEARGHNFSKEALIAVLDYVLLGQRTTLQDGNLDGLGLTKAIIETAVANGPLRGLMASLRLKHLEREAPPDHKRQARLNIPLVTYIITKPEWLRSRKRIKMNWMPEGQQVLSEDESPDLQELEHGHPSGAVLSDGVDEVLG